MLKDVISLGTSLSECMVPPVSCAFSGVLSMENDDGITDAVGFEVIMEPAEYLRPGFGSIAGFRPNAATPSDVLPRRKECTLSLLAIDDFAFLDGSCGTDFWKKTCFYQYFNKVGNLCLNLSIRKKL